MTPLYALALLIGVAAASPDTLDDQADLMENEARCMMMQNR